MWPWTTASSRTLSTEGRDRRPGREGRSDQQRQEMRGQSMEMTFEDTFQPAYKGKLFVVNPAKIRYSFNIDVDPMTPEGKGMDEKVKKLLTARKKARRSAKEKAYGPAINDTDSNPKKHTPKLKPN